MEPATVERTSGLAARGKRASLFYFGERRGEGFRVGGEKSRHFPKVEEKTPSKLFIKEEERKKEAG